MAKAKESKSAAPKSSKPTATRGQGMKAARGKANPARVNEILKKTLAA